MKSLIFLIRQLAAVGPLKTEAAAGEGPQVEGQGGGRGGARGLGRGAALRVVGVGVEGGGEVVHAQGLAQLGVHQRQPSHLNQNMLFDLLKIWKEHILILDGSCSLFMNVGRILLVKVRRGAWSHSKSDCWILAEIKLKYFPLYRER